MKLNLTCSALVFAILAVPAPVAAQTSSVDLLSAIGSSTLTSVAPETPRINFSFVNDGHEAVELPEDQEPYFYNFQRKLYATTHDAEGIASREVDGVFYDHPVAQAQYMITRLNTYRINQDPEYLELIEKHAARLMSYSADLGNATFLPYPFDFPVHDRDLLEAPWHSGMAQGTGLSAFTRLYEVTGDIKYKEFADRLFESFLLPKSDPAEPWVTQVDENGFLWFEEYARGDYADFTYNGLMYAVIGLYDYYQLTKDATVLELYQGGVSTLLHYAEEIRNPGDVSSYCLAHPEVKSKTYHEVHIREFHLLARMTGEPEFTRYAELFREDYTPPTT